MFPTNNLHVKEIARLISPNDLKAQFPVSDAANKTVFEGRRRVLDILEQRDPRLLVVVGPCSIHDVNAAIDYGSRIKALREECGAQLEIIMRVYFEKPRTTLGWKGLINDPHLDGSSDIETGLKMARKLLIELTAMGVPAATEFLDPIVPQYIGDLVSWAAIGARTTESQTHRELASGLSMPVGFKNGTDGSLQIALDAMQSARAAHSFLGIDPDGMTAVVRTTGNPAGHVVLRGGRSRTNYDAESIREAEAKLRQNGLPPILMVDCSHANSNKQHGRQEEIWRSLVDQRVSGTKSIVGVMIESFINEGNQAFPRPVSELAYGVSITDACIGWDLTEQMLRSGAEKLAASKAGLVAAH